MKIKNIRLKNYRNYDNLNISFCDNLNIIIGDNAQGKTNLLEAIYVLAVTKSFLSINDHNLIKFGNKCSFIEGLIEKKNSTLDLEILLNDNGKFVKINHKEIKKLSEYISKMNVIIFSADSIRMLKESPSTRRKYFNIQISQINKRYLKMLTDYNIILRQRNEFLKIIDMNKKTDTDYLEIINDKYVDLSLKIYNFRDEYVKNINSYLGNMFFSITDFDGLKLKYISNIDNSRDNLLEKLNKNINKEIQYKMTLIGPNRDDFCFYLNDKNLSLYGSQGQMRSAIIALKMSEVFLFTDKVGDSPILLLDDMFSELDINKRNNILANLTHDVQTIITTTDIDNINENIRKKANVYEIKDVILFPGN